VSDDALIGAFQAVDRARGETTLSEFEFGTLATLKLFTEAKLDAVILEVGLGGRLDAVNIVDPDVAIISSVDLDHELWLGNDRESVGREKAGIMREGIRVVCGDTVPPKSLLARAAALHADLRIAGRDFGIRKHTESWDLTGPRNDLAGLPYPALRGGHQTGNAAAVLTALGALSNALPVDRPAIDTGLRAVRLAGRFQRLDTDVNTLADIAHNPAAAAGLAADLDANPVSGKELAVFSVLADKDAAGIIDAIGIRFRKWYVATAGCRRGLAAEDIRDLLVARLPAPEVTCHRDVVGAFASAQAQAGEGDRIVVFGSAFAVGELLYALEV
ncbi:MAG: bifunctional folylpolyglutamate synthase/dihydrofolate synthase, partial [Pseudomonadota bacterium]|nr:bifunctional folylpolyglutamate synthase/dihydrofolate synthase [Pseudomonadota bacterium]